MDAVAIWARASLARNWRAWLSLALSCGLAWGVVLACVAGARRTDSAYPRFARRNLAATLVVFPPSDVKSDFDFSPLTRVRQVVASGVASGFDASTGIVVVLGNGYGRRVNVPRVLSGRLPRPDEPDAAAVTYTYAQSAHLHVGDRLAVNLLGPPPPGGRQPVVPVELRVVGIEVSPGEFPPLVTNRSFVAQFLVTPAFASANAGRLGAPVPTLAVRLAHGDADLPAFNAALRRASASRPDASPLVSGQQSSQAVNVERGIHLQAQALLLLGAFVALTATVVIWQLLARQSRIEGYDHATLRAIGMTGRQLWLAGVAVATLSGLVAAAIAALTAVAISPLLPIGTARLAETSPGLQLDGLVVGAGAVLVLAVLPALAAGTWRRTTPAAGDLHGEIPASLSTSGRVVAAAGLPATVGIGATMALQAGRDRAAVPVKSSLASVTVGVLALATALTFGASLTHLLTTPRLYGWNWDLHLVNIGSNRGSGIAPLAKLLQSDPRIEAVAIDDSPPVTVANQDVSSLVVDDLKGHLAPVVVRGRAPESPDEVALGERTLRATHAHIGDTVNVSITPVRQLKVPKRVVGTVILPPESDSAALGVGVVMTGSGERTLIPPEVHPPLPSEVLLRVVRGTDRGALLADLGRRAGPEIGIYTPKAPNDLVNFGHVQHLPLILAGLLAVLGLATLAHTLVTSVRRRARDLAVLRALGFLPRQIRRVVAWQSTTFVCVALAIGLPLGVAAGRLVWDAFASGLGTVPEPMTPPWGTVLIVPAALVLANLVAGVPALIASRTRPAMALRME